MRIRSMLLAAALCVIAATNSFGASYNVIDLGAVPGGTSSCAYGINESGQVVGESFLESGGSHAFLWEAATGMQDLGGTSGSRATSINNRGQIVGTSHMYYGALRAFGWSVGTGMRDLGTLNGGQSWGYDITDDGHVFGVSISSDRNLRVFEWSVDSGMSDLGLPSSVRGPDCTISVNEARQVAGTFRDTESGSYRAFLWDAAVGMRDIGPGFADGISENGKIVGRSSDQAFLWDTMAGMRLLGTLQGDDPDVVGDLSAARGVNDLGQVVGDSHFYNGDQWVTAGFIWEEATGMIELPSLGGTYSNALAINSAGLIAGFSSEPDGTTHAVLWAPVPEPGSLLALGSGVSGLLLFFRRRNR